MWAFSAAPPNQLIYGADHHLLCCRAFLFFGGGGGSASIIIIRQNRIFLVRSVCVCVCSCSTSVWDKSLLGCANCVCVRVLGCWCCCWDYEGCSALVGMRGELLGHILGTPRR